MLFFLILTFIFYFLLFVQPIREKSIPNRGPSTAAAAAASIDVRHPPDVRRLARPQYYRLLPSKRYPPIKREMNLLPEKYPLPPKKFPVKTCLIHNVIDEKYLKKSFIDLCDIKNAVFFFDIGKRKIKKK